MMPPAAGPGQYSPGKGCQLLYYFLPVTVCTMLLFCACCRIIRGYLALQRTRRRAVLISEMNNVPHEPSTVLQLESTGLACSVIRSLPAIPFRKGIIGGGGGGDGHENNNNIGCVICLRKFRGGEWLRLLPNCAHVFHVRCIDTWFRSHSTCPLCRRNVLYDFNDDLNSSSVSLMVDSFETLQREEKALGYQLLYELYMSGPPYETEYSDIDDESSQGFVSPVGRPSNQPRQAVQIMNPIKMAPNNIAESSSRDLGSYNEDNIHAPSPLA